jgi:hypothetical protein
VNLILMSALERTMKRGILNRSQFCITDTSISVKRYRLYGQSALDSKLIGIITEEHTKTMISKINRPCWLKYYCQPGVLSVPAPGHHTKQDACMVTLRGGSGYRVIAMVISSMPVRAAWGVLLFKPRKALMSEDLPDPEPPQIAK